MYYSYHKLITDNKIGIRYGGQIHACPAFFCYYYKINVWRDGITAKKILNKYTGFNLILIRYENDFENTIKKINKLQSAKMPSGCISLNWLICWNKTKRNNKKKKLFIVRFIVV